MKKHKRFDINKMRISIFHTKCMTVSEIAEAMGITVSEVEYALNEMGYKPIYKKDAPAPNEFVVKAKAKKRSEKA